MPISWQCLTCSHYWSLGFCSAFPAGIPEDISNGMRAHDTIIPGQRGKFVYTKAAPSPDSAESDETA